MVSQPTRQPINLSDWEAFAVAKLPATVVDYFAGGAEDEATVAGNIAAFSRWAFSYHVLTGGGADPTTVLFGQRLSSPVLLAPTGMQGLAHPEAEIAAAVGARQADTIYCASTMATRSLEEIATVEGDRWFQLYVFRDRDVSLDLVRRAEEAGYSALVLTVDTPVLGRRERDIRNQFALPEGLTYANFQGRAAGTGAAQVGGSALNRYVADLFDSTLTWADAAWLIKQTRLPVLLKGIVRPDDAVRAVDAGAAGVIVSNHGGRQLDHSIATLDALPEVAAAVGDRAVVMVDGGIRRGTDVLKALCLGARAVLIGRPYLWALASDGAAGVELLLQALRNEVFNSLALLGAADLSELSADLVCTPHNPGFPFPAPAAGRGPDRAVP
ncbi:MAG: alpha-hydroxy acid oxidase [Candidatus Dormibacteria bacterium]